MNKRPATKRKLPAYQKGGLVTKPKPVPVRKSTEEMRWTGTVETKDGKEYDTYRDTGQQEWIYDKRTPPKPKAKRT
jgi:hypothetical protein